MAKPGKYAHILPHLPKFTPDAKKQERIDATIRLIEDEISEQGTVLTAENLTAQFSEMRKRKDWLKSVLRDVQTKLDAYAFLVERYFEIEGISSLKLSDKAGVRLQSEVYSKVLDREAFRLWCIKNGFEKELRLWPSTTQAMVRERLLLGKGAPDGVEATNKAKAVYMKGEIPIVDDSWLDDYAEEFGEDEEQPL